MKRSAGRKTLPWKPKTNCNPYLSWCGESGTHGVCVHRGSKYGVLIKHRGGIVTWVFGGPSWILITMPCLPPPRGNSNKVWVALTVIGARAGGYFVKNVVNNNCMYGCTHVCAGGEKREKHLLIYVRVLVFIFLTETFRSHDAGLRLPSFLYVGSPGLLAFLYV